MEITTSTDPDIVINRDSISQHVFTREGTIVDNPALKMRSRIITKRRMIHRSSSHYQ